MKKPQRLLLTVSGDFAELIPWEIFHINILQSYVLKQLTQLIE